MMTIGALSRLMAILDVFIESNPDLISKINEKAKEYEDSVFEVYDSIDTSVSRELDKILRE